METHDRVRDPRDEQSLGNDVIPRDPRDGLKRESDVFPCDYRDVQLKKSDIHCGDGGRFSRGVRVLHGDRP